MYCLRCANIMRVLESNNSRNGSDKLVLNEHYKSIKQNLYIDVSLYLDAKLFLLVVCENGICLLLPLSHLSPLLLICRFEYLSPWFS